MRREIPLQGCNTYFLDQKFKKSPWKLSPHLFLIHFFLFFLTLASWTFWTKTATEETSYITIKHRTISIYFQLTTWKNTYPQIKLVKKHDYSYKIRMHWKVKTAWQYCRISDEDVATLHLSSLMYLYHSTWALAANEIFGRFLDISRVLLILSYRCLKWLSQTALTSSSFTVKNSKNTVSQLIFFHFSFGLNSRTKYPLLPLPIYLFKVPRWFSVGLLI